MSADVQLWLKRRGFDILQDEVEEMKRVNDMLAQREESRRESKLREANRDDKARMIAEFLLKIQDALDKMKIEQMTVDTGLVWEAEGRKTPIAIQWRPPVLGNTRIVIGRRNPYRKSVPADIGVTPKGTFSYNHRGMMYDIIREWDKDMEDRIEAEVVDQAKIEETKRWHGEEE